MATQQISQSYESFIELLVDAAEGARVHGAAIGLEQNTEAKLRPELEAIIGRPAGPDENPPELPGHKARWGVAKAGKLEAGETLRHARDNGRTLASACVNTLKARLGNRWTSKWEAAGFSGGTLELPDNPLTVLQQLRAYFAANPSHEVPNLNDGLHATAAGCYAAAQAIAAASALVSQRTIEAGAAKEVLDASLKQARKRLIGLREELAQLLARDDKRWYAFGFDRPSDPQTPEVPGNLQATPGGGIGSLFLTWDDARRAENYRVLVHDTTGREIFERLVSETQFMLTGLASGQTVHLTVSARNGRGGESVPSVVLVATVG